MNFVYCKNCNFWPNLTGMKRLFHRKHVKHIFIIAILVAIVATFTFLTKKTPVDFTAQVKPLLNKNCITCHGGVKRQAGFSLLFRSDALANTESGKPAIIPGDPDNSEFIRRLTLKDPEERMPYKHPQLSDDDIDMLRRWIKEGAKWGDHWAYVPVQPVTVPVVEMKLADKEWGDNNIDKFITEKLVQMNLQPSPEASKATLLRRVSLDVIGLPASQQIAENFLKQNNANAYEKLVDDLLASPQFGERWAATWMDLARYADTKGYERDDSRNIWRYRDWLIDAFNKDKPYDEFLIDQLAGDLLPNPSDAQYIATAFHRNTMTNDEGGTDNEEFRTAAVIDRVNTTWETIMGSTFACVQCHSHPYDPFRHEEYYKFMAFFNNTRDEDTYAEYPLLREFHQQDSSKFISLQNWLKQYAPERAAEISHFLKTGEPTINSIAADSFTNSALTDTKWLVLRNNAVARLKNVEFNNQTQLLFRYQSWKPGGKWVIHTGSATGPVIGNFNASNTNGKWTTATISIPAINAKQHLYFTYTNANLKTAEETGIQFDWFYFTNPFPGKGKPGYDEAYESFNALLSPNNVTLTPVMVDNIKAQFRSTHVFDRGNWLVKGEEVQPDVPQSLNPLPTGAPRNRLGMAMWMVDKKNPLTARAIVNRIWEQFFGQGIAETLEDLGTQGVPPTHKELLDYLSYKLMHEYKWSLKKLVKEILLSATYKQDAKLTATATEKDPFNRYYARGARVRLSAEQIRDQALAVSSLLNNKMFGPSVFPYQPGGIWLSPWNGATWQESKENEQHRRAVYTYWKRTAPYPSMITFDGTAREVCSARRIRTNTPLQALVTLNDSVYTESATYFAYRMQDAGGSDVKKQIGEGYKLMFYTSISPQKLAVLEKLYNEALKQFVKDKNKMMKMAGERKEKQSAETAALITVAGAMMNMDEFISKN